MACFRRFDVLRLSNYAFCVGQPSCFSVRSFVSSRHKISNTKKEILKESLNYYIENHNFKLGVMEARGCFGVERHPAEYLAETFSDNCPNWRFVWYKVFQGEYSGLVSFRNVDSSILFAKGYRALNLYINDGPLDPEVTIAFNALERFFDEKAYHEDSLEILQNTKEKLSETQVASLLAQHLLSQLLPYPSNYYLDKFSRGKPDCCPCGCGVPVQFGFTHLGCPQLFQGNVDMVFFPDNKDLFMMDSDNKVSAVFKVVRNGHQETDQLVMDHDDRSDEIDEDAVTLGDEKLSEFSADKTVRESCKQAIAASVCKYRGLINGSVGELNEDYSKLCIVPVCSITKDSYDVTAYDAKHDFLLKTCHGSLKLFEADKSVKFSAMIDLWLMIHHDKFCTVLHPKALNAINGTCKLVPQLGKEIFTSVVRNSTWFYQASTLGKQPDYLPKDPSVNLCVNEMEKISWRDVC